MTFKELVNKYSFEEIVSDLLEITDKANLFLYRQAFDILRTLTPSSGEHGDIIEVVHIDAKPRSYNRVRNIFDGDWAENLNMEIKVDPECCLSEKQVLALCLWERTFYGFSPAQELETIKSWDNPQYPDSVLTDNPYFKLLVELKRRNFKKYVKPRNRKYDSFGLPIWPDNYIVGGIRRRKKNRFKKAMRRYRERCNILETMCERVELIKDIYSKYPTVTLEDLNFLICDKEIIFTNFKSRVSSSKDICDYITESIVKYSDLPPTCKNEPCILLCQVPSGVSIQQDDQEKLSSTIQSKIGNVPIRLHIRFIQDLDSVGMSVIYLSEVV